MVNTLSLTTRVDEMKKAVPVRPFWYSDIFVFPKLITVITTLDKQGRVNAAPYSHIMQYDVMHKTPRLFLGFRNTSHTFENIRDTGEFVVNCPTADHLEDMMETARFYGDGINELEHTGFTAIPSTKVKPPTIKECPQVVECSVDKVYELDQTQGHVLGKIEALMFDEELIDMDREQRLHALNLPIGLGDAKRKYYYYSYTDNIVMHELQDAPDEDANPLRKKKRPKTKMPWEDAALEQLLRVPRPVRSLVIRQTEKHVKEQGDATVTAKHFATLANKYGFGDQEVMDRFSD